MFHRVLIANRGEIACRIARTCHRIGVASVALAGTGDRTARHVALADDAVAIDGPGGGYLAIERIVEAARATGAEAIYPGYGFLAENADFAEAVRAAGLVFVGPAPAAIRAMGAKDAAKRLMAEAGIPCVPGFSDDSGDDTALLAAAERVGFPLLVKAAAGGGGKGMRVVRRAAELPDALEAARSEARRAFGDDRLILERYLERARHIEAQVLADAHGRTLFLFERECTLQRRHQKVVEEAPSPTLDQAARTRLGELAVRAARAVGYVNAGTIEFLHADGEPWFIEMNTRLQVEHPVTEMVTGLDLVEWQLRIAAGEALPFGQEDLRLRGHAVEARLYAEDPDRGFLPATGRLHIVRFPDPSSELRVESGIAEKAVIGLDYDPMLAKLVAHGPDRATALARLDRALALTRIVGVRTNRGHLRSVLNDPAVHANTLDTTWLERRAVPPTDGLLADAVWLAVADRLAERAERASTRARQAGDPHGPWQAVDGFRLGAPARQTIRLEAEGRRIEVEATVAAPGWRVHRDGQETRLVVVDSHESLVIEVGGRRIEGLVVRDGETRFVAMATGDVRLLRVAAVASGADEGAADGIARAPMPGRVVEVAVAPGDRVRKGALLARLEAMKMEHRVTAEITGRVVEVAVVDGASVAAGDRLVELVPAEDAG